jgi:hypothetical protein
VAVPFSVELKVQALASRATAEVQTVWKVGQRQRTLESRLRWTIEGSPRLQLRAIIPQDLEVDQVVAPGAYEWAITSRGQDRVLTAYLATSQAGAAVLIVRGSLGPPGSVPLLSLPKIEALDVDRQQGEIVVQADPALNVETADLVNCEVILLEQTRGWLSPAQQELARLALAYRDPNYQGSLRLSLRQPRVQGTTLTNVRLSDRSIEETILIDLVIREAGIREVTFLLPAALADAKISAPLLRQKTIEPLAAQAGNENVRVRIELQDAVMGDFRVLIEHDSLYTREAHSAPIPVLETGQTTDRYVALETSARDEVVVESSTGFEPVIRGQQRSAALAQLMASSATQAFRVQPEVVAPKLVYRPRDRALVETVAARIGLAETELACDAYGAYRGLQTYHVYNSTEAYLEVELPPGARIWTARVAGEPVKPVQATGKSKAERVRIPLVKSAAGDLDYTLELTYGGKLPAFGVLSRVQFPLLRTVNIGVEQSQVRLYLPADERWMEFGGTMRSVSEEADLAAGNLSYLTKMTRRLTESLRSDDPFAQTRAQVNLDQLGQRSAGSGSNSFISNGQFQQELAGNAVALREAQQQAAKLQTPAVSVENNRQRLSTIYSGQNNGQGLNVVERAGDNFQLDESIVAGDREQTANQAGQFDNRWYYRNNLSDSPTTVDASKSAATNSFRSQVPVSRLPAVDAKDLPPSSTVPQAVDKLGRQQITLGIQAAAPESQTAAPEGQVVQRYAEALKRKSEKKEAESLEIPQSQAAFAPHAGVAGGGQGVAQSSNLKLDSGRDRGLASLAIEIPRSGTVYRFTTLRGDVEITARSVPTALVENLVRLAIVIGVVLAARWVFGLFTRRKPQQA